ncbi:hypothetical protein ACHWQZ_G008199 [Mnemiopsis leidyi]
MRRAALVLLIALTMAILLEFTENSLVEGHSSGSRRRSGSSGSRRRSSSNSGFAGSRRRRYRSNSG